MDAVGNLSTVVDSGQRALGGDRDSSSSLGGDRDSSSSLGGDRDSFSSLGGDRDSSRRVLTGCFLFLLILTTLLGNTLVCTAVAKFRHLRSKVTNLFVISLAVSDLLVALVVMPWKAWAETTGSWPLPGPLLCDLWVALDIMCSTASILNLCVISVDRYWAVCRPFRYQRDMTAKVACVMVAVAWTLSALISFIPVQLGWHRAAPPPPGPPNGTEPPPPDNCDSSLNRTYAISSSLISFYIPVAVMVVTYTRIYRIAQKQIRRISALERAAESAKHRHQGGVGGANSSSAPESESSFKMSFKRETKVLKTLSVIVGVFVFCWLPFFVLNCMVPFCEAADPDGRGQEGGAFPCVSASTFDVFVWCGWANSSLNPIIYAFNADFRRAFSSLLGCRRLCPPLPPGGGGDVQAVNNDNVALNVGAEQQQYQPKSHIPTDGHQVAAAGHGVPHGVLCQEEEEEEEEELPRGEEAGHQGAMAADREPSGTPDSDDTEPRLEETNPITQNGLDDCFC